MIQICSCIVRSASTIKPSKTRKGVKSCNKCGRRLSVDGQDPLADSMLSAVGLELSRAIDPHLNWKTAKNTKKRAVRRARTSFSGGNLTIHNAENSNYIDELTYKYNEDMPVSEYEKVGVSILGRRFNDALESVPIKKRRFLASPSPLPESTLSNSSGRCLEGSHNASDALSVFREVKEEVSSIIQSKLDLPGSHYDENTNAENKIQKMYGTADFSGISILAAAACNSSIAGDFSDIEVSVSKGLPSKDEEFSANSKGVDPETLTDAKVEQHLTSSDNLEGKNDPSSGKDLEVLVVEKSSTSMKDSINHRQTVSSSRSTRFHWDLNTVMEAWESNYDEVIVNSDLCTTSSGNDSRSHHEHQANARSFCGQMGLGDGKDAPEAVADGSHLVWNMVSKSEEQGSEYAGGDLSGDNDREGLSRCRLSNTDSRPGDAQASFLMDSLEQKPCNEISFAAKTESLPDGNSHGSQEGSSADAPCSEPAVGEEESYCLESDNGLSYDPKVGYPDPTDKEQDRNGSSGIDMGKVLVVSASDDGNVIIDHDLKVASTDDDGSLREPQSPQLTSLSPDFFETGINNQCLAATELDHASADRNASQNDSHIIGVISEAAHVETSDEKFKGARRTENIEEMHMKSCMFDINMSSQDVHKTELYGSISTEYLETETCIKIEDENIPKSSESSAAVPMGNLAIKHANIDTSRPADDSPEFLMGDLTTRRNAEVDKAAVGVVGSRSECKSSGDGHERSGKEIASEHCSFSHCDSSAYHNETNQAVATERVELEDDYQYEDGEFRESFAYSWGDGETEHVDYGSDNRDTDACEMASEVPSVSLHAENLEFNRNLDVDCNEEEQLDYDDVHEDSSQKLLKCSPGYEPNTASGKRKIENDFENTSGIHAIEERQQLERNVNTTRELGKAKRDGPNDGDAAGHLGHKECSRVKSSGWDRLPETCYGDSSRPAETLRRRARSPPVRELPSKFERPRFYDISYKKDQYYPSRNRSGKNNDFRSDDERDGHDPRTIRRGQSPLLGRGVGRVDQWMGSANHWRSSYRHDSPNLSGPNKYRHPVSNNAVATTIAKLESSGFVVGPDGTIIKAGMPRKSASSGSLQRGTVGRVSPVRKDGGYGVPLGLQKSRQMSADRHVHAGPGRPGRYGPRMVSPSRRERYRPPLTGGSSRDRSFSPPQRSPLHLSRSHTRSPSTSRSRSPRIWASPKGRVDNRMNGGVGFRRRSRSPTDYKLPNRSERLRFPHHKPVYSERIIRYTPPREQSSPRDSSGWIDERKNSCSRGYKYDMVHSVRQYERDSNVNCIPNGNEDGYKTNSKSKISTQPDQRTSMPLGRGNGSHL